MKLVYSGSVALLFLILLAASQLNAQNTVAYLRAEEAVRLAIEQNLGTEVARQNQDIARRNYSWGNAGFLPSVSATAAKNWSVADEELQLNFGESINTVNRAGARSNNLNAGIAANWVVFDGLQMFHAYDRLRLQYEGSRLLNQQTVNELTAAVLSNYYLHTLQQQRLDLWRNTLELSQQRLRLAKDRYEVGKTSKQEYLAALVDYNADQASWLAQDEALQNSRHELNRLLGQSPRQPLQTIDTLRADSLMMEALLLPQQVNQNPEYRATELRLAATSAFIKEQRASYWPRLSANLGYNFSTLNNQVGNLLFRQSKGFVYGFSASWMLFDGMNARRNVQIARIESKLVDLERQQLQLDLESAQADALAAYRTQWQQISLEQENLEYARQSADIALDRYSLGVATPLELRAAQQNAQQAELRLLNAVYELKLAEIELMRISGELAPAY